MRIWSIHPKYLDAKGLVALWRETLLAKNVLENKTKGYKNHPQLTRFKNVKYPVDSINYYLSFILEEAGRRGYNFNSSKVASAFKKSKLTVTSDQLKYEMQHLLRKLKKRDPKRFKQLSLSSSFDPHPMFRVKEGEIESWEIL